MLNLYMKISHGGEKVNFNSENVFVGNLILTHNQFKDKFGKLPNLYFTIKTPKHLLNATSIFDIEIQNTKPQTKVQMKKAKTIENKSKGLGIDIIAKGKDIKAIFYKHYSKICLSANYDPEEMLQEVFLGILSRNGGSCPFDATKSSFSTYIVMVCRCVVFNVLNKEKKMTSKFKIFDKDDDYDVDTFFTKLKDNSAPLDSCLLIEEARNLCSSELKSVFDELIVGNNITQISKSLQIENRKVNQMVNKIKKIVSPLLNITEDKI